MELADWALSPIQSRRAGKWGFARLRRHALVAGWADEEDYAADASSSSSNAAAGGATTTTTGGGSGVNGNATDGGLLSLSAWRRNWKRAAYTALDRAESLMRLAWCVMSRQCRLC